MENGTNYKKIELTSYKRFQWFWLASHGFSLEELVQALVECAGKIVSDDETLTFDAVLELFEETGLGNGSLYPCLDEFLGAEYQDPDLMRLLLDNQEYTEYQKAIYEKWVNQGV